MMTPTNSIFSRSVLWSAIFCVLSSAGCLSGRHFSFRPQDSETETFRIDYALRNAEQELDPWSSFADQEFMTANWSHEKTLPVSAVAPKSSELSIEYPHPQKGETHALATLKVYSGTLPEQRFVQEVKQPWYKQLLRKPWKSEEAVPAIGPSEIITLDLTHSQFDLLMSDLSQETYLEEAGRKAHGSNSNDASLQVLENEKAIHTSGMTDPRLNEIVRRIYREGDVVMGERTQPRAILHTAAQIEAPAPNVLE